VTDIVYLDVKKEHWPYKAWAQAAKEFNEKSPSPVTMCVRGTEGAKEGEDSGNNIRAAFVRHANDLGPLDEDDMFESFGKRSADCDLLLGATLPREDHSDVWELPYALAEAGLVRILVIDERMTERALTPYTGPAAIASKLLKKRDDDKCPWNPCFWHLAQRAKVYIATHLAVGDDTDPLPLHESFADAESSHTKATSNTRPACPYLKLRISSAGLNVAEKDNVYGYNRYGPAAKPDTSDKKPPRTAKRPYANGLRKPILGWLSNPGEAFLRACKRSPSGSCLSPCSIKP
jgi:hypothetical protein